MVHSWTLIYRLRNLKIGIVGSDAHGLLRNVGEDAIAQQALRISNGISGNKSAGGKYHSETLTVADS
jgi:hypothetical protein